MKKLISMVFVFFTLTLSTFIFVSAEETETLYDEANETQREGVVIEFSRALQMSLDDMLAIQDFDIIIRDMRMAHTDLHYQLRRLETGAVRREARAPLNQALQSINIGLVTLEMQQASVGNQIDGAMTDALAALSMSNYVGFGTELSDAIAGMIRLGAIGGAVEDLRASRDAIIRQLNELDEDFFRDIADDARRGVHEIERQINNVELHQNLIMVQLEHALRGIVVVISELGSTLEIMEKSMDLADDGLIRARLSYELGMISSHEMLTIELNTSQGHTQLAELHRARERVVQNLNLLIGQPFDQYTVIEFELYVPEMPEDLDSHIEELIEQSASIRQLRNQALSARAERRAYTGNDRDINISASDRRRAMEAAGRDERVMVIRNRIALQEAVERADTALDQAVRSMEFALRQAYNELAALKIQLETAYRELALAKSTLNVSLASFSVGRITQFEVDQAELAVVRAKQSIESLYYQLWVLAFGLLNPELL